MAPPPLHLPTRDFRRLLELQGPSLALWRGAEIAALREQCFEQPVLDLGCGDGVVTSMVLPQVALGVDPDAGALQRAARTGIYEVLERATAQTMDVPDGRIATVLSNSVLEHLPRIEDVLFALARVLRPGGHLIFTTPTEVLCGQLLLPWKPYTGWRNRALSHLNIWPLRRWRTELERVGLQLQVVRHYLVPRLVWAWDTLDLMQAIWIGSRRVFSPLWRAIPPSGLDLLARCASQLDLSSSAPGGGRLLVAKKVC